MMTPQIDIQNSFQYVEYLADNLYLGDFLLPDDNNLQVEQHNWTPEPNCDKSSKLVEETQNLNLKINQPNQQNATKYNDLAINSIFRERIQAHNIAQEDFKTVFETSLRGEISL